VRDEILPLGLIVSFIYVLIPSGLFNTRFKIGDFKQKSPETDIHHKVMAKPAESIAKLFGLQTV